MAPPSPMDLAGRTAVVTGAARGIGLAVCAELLELGANVVGLDLSPLPADSDTPPQRLVGLQGDICDPEAVRAALEAAVDLPGKLGILVHSVYAEERQPLLEGTLAGWRRSLDVMVTAVHQADVAFVRALAGQPGSIVHLASQHAFGAVPEFGAYAVAKAALLALTRAAAVEWAPLGVRCNAVAPGFIQVGRNQSVWEDGERLSRLLRSYPMGRAGTPQEVAHAVAFLASDASSFTTGSCLAVDGGQTAALPEAFFR